MAWCPNCGAEYREGYTRCDACGVDLVSESPSPSPPPGPEWVPVAGYATEDEAVLAAGVLAQEGIGAEVVNKHVVLYPFPLADEAEVLVVVKPADLERADAVLAGVEAGAEQLGESEPEPEGGVDT